MSTRQVSLSGKSVAISDDVTLTILEIDSLDDDLILLMDEYLVSICEGIYSDSTLVEVKERVKELFRDKSSEDGDYTNWEMGAVAEFYIHLYLNLENFKQECLFFNLEERSIKKGFDGYYTASGDQWVMESKSGSLTTVGISHKSKLSEAISDLKAKFSGNVKSNPWSNAFNHASHVDVSTASQIRKYIKSLSKDFTSNVFHDISEFNIIPCATIYYEDGAFSDAQEIEESVSSSVASTANKMHMICVSQRSVGVFKEYIGIK